MGRRGLAYEPRGNAGAISNHTVDWQWSIVPVDTLPAAPGLGQTVIVTIFGVGVFQLGAHRTRERGLLDCTTNHYVRHLTVGMYCSTPDAFESSVPDFLVRKSSRPHAERFSHREDLAEMIAVVIVDEQDRPQVGLVSFTRRHQRV